MRGTGLAILIGLFVGGCAEPTLVRELEDAGVTTESTGRIVFRGSESDVGSDVRMDVIEQFIIQEVWDAIYLNRPYDVWYPSGYRRLDFYGDPESPEPTVTLYVNESGAAHVDGGSGRRYRCPGLHELAMKLLEETAAEREPAESP